MENAEAEAAPDELEVVQVLWVDARSRVDLKRVVVVCRVLKQTVERVEHLVRKQEEELAVAPVSHVSPKRKMSSHRDRPP
jgi:hypothetical protein